MLCDRPPVVDESQPFSVLFGDQGSGGGEKPNRTGRPAVNPVAVGIDVHPGWDHNPTAKLPGVRHQTVSIRV